MIQPEHDRTLKDLLICCDGEIADPEAKFVVKEDIEAEEGSVKITIELTPSSGQAEVIASVVKSVAKQLHTRPM